MFIENKAVQTIWSTPDRNVHGDNMGPIWGRQGPGGPHDGPMKFAIWDASCIVCAAAK